MASEFFPIDTPIPYVVTPKGVELCEQLERADGGAPLGRSPAVLPSQKQGVPERPKGKGGPAMRPKAATLRVISTGYEPPTITEGSCPTCKNLLLALSAAVKDFNQTARPALANYAALSFNDVSALEERLAPLGKRVRDARSRYEKHVREQACA